MSQNYCSSYAEIKPNHLTKHYYNCEIITDCYNLLVNRHRNLHRNLFLIYRAAQASKSSSFFKLEQARFTRNSPTQNTQQRLAIVTIHRTVSTNDICR